MEHPTYSPDLAPCDFFLFGHLKGKMKGIALADRSELEAWIYQELEKIDEKTIVEVFRSWIKRLEILCETKGDYYCA